jgi:thioesterase domain-containing protein
MDAARLTRGRPVPLFLIGGLEGPPHPGLPLAGALGPEVPCRGLDLPGRDGERPPLDDVLAMAVHLLPSVLVAQPFGPYQLAGYACGGLVAYELARLLRGLGQPVRPVILLDTVLPLAGHPPLPADPVLAVRELARMRHLACGWQGACRCGVDHGAPLAAQGARIARALGAPGPHHYEEHILTAIGVYTAGLRAFATYQPGPSDLRVVLIRSADWSNVWGLPSQIARHTSPCLGWERVPVAGLRLHVVATDRPSLFAGSALDDVVGIVTYYLGRPTGPGPVAVAPPAGAVDVPGPSRAAPAPGLAPAPPTKPLARPVPVPVIRRGPAAWPDDLQVSVS